MRGTTTPSIYKHDEGAFEQQTHVDFLYQQQSRQINMKHQRQEKLLLIMLITYLSHLQFLFGFRGLGCGGCSL